MYVVTTQRLNFGVKESKTQFAVYISNLPLPVTFKQSQGHQIYNDNVDTKQAYNHAKFERSCFNSVWEKAYVKSFFQTRNISIPSLEHVQK